MAKASRKTGTRPRGASPLKSSAQPRQKQRAPRERPEKRVLVLQGGGALGSYQAGVYEELAKGDFLPHWIAGISIGAVNAAIIAGNPPEQRVRRLSEFWELISSGLTGEPPQRAEQTLALYNELSAVS